MYSLNARLVMVKLSVNCAKTGVATAMRAEKGLHVGYTGLTSKRSEDQDRKFETRNQIMGPRRGRPEAS